MLLVFMCGTENLFVGQILFVILFISFIKLVENLSFLQSPVADGSKDRIPVPEAVFTEYGFLIGRFCK